MIPGRDMIDTPKPDPTRTDSKPEAPCRTDRDIPDPGGERRPAT